MLHLLIIICCITCRQWHSNAQNISIKRDGTLFNIELKDGKLLLETKKGAVVQLKGEIGIGVTKPLNKCADIDNCYELDNNKLLVTSNIESGITIHWTSESEFAVFKDCFELGTRQWYGGPERFHQHWPIQKLVLDNFANVPQEADFSAITEPYWLNSAGTYIYVNERVPLFIDQNSTTTKNQVCFSAKNSKPYPTRKKITLQYSIVTKQNPREAHLHAVHHFLGKPTGHPISKIIQRPIWSTWARYKRDINDTVLRQFFHEILDNGYSNGQFEIDDDWEDCYGALTFKESKFSKINETVRLIKSKNFTVSLWVHPFVNTDCQKYTNIGISHGYFVKNTEGSVLTKWWNSQDNQAQYLDFTKPEVRNWFSERLKVLQEKHGINSFKFDAGETSWSPQLPVLEGDIELTPNSIVSDYVRTCAAFNNLAEVRVGWRTQDLPVFVRMLDKDSTWGSNNGLYTLITTLLQMNLNGYTMVLPDMIGGNGYNAQPSAELFIRWLQANSLMPSLQFSYVPWDYKNDKKIDVIEISKRFVTLHEKFANYIIKQMRRSIVNGFPVNAPIWWVDPVNLAALKEDTEYLLGEDVLVAPVIQEGATFRNIILPIGNWVDGNTKEVHKGPKEIKAYHAPIEMLPYFLRQGSDVDADEYYMGSGLVATYNAAFTILAFILTINNLL